jgi:hypothetical protein
MNGISESSIRWDGSDSGSVPQAPTVQINNVLHSALGNPYGNPVDISCQIQLVVSDGGSPITSITATGPDGQSITVNENTSTLIFNFQMPMVDVFSPYGEGEAEINVVATNAVGASIPSNALIRYSY